MSTVQDVLKILRSRGDNPEEMEQVMQNLSKEEQAKLKDLQITLIDQIDCPRQCEVLADYCKMLKIASEAPQAPQTETDKPVGNDWRIYLWGMARRTNKHLIEWCRDAVKNGRLPKRIDHNGLLYIYVNDLLPYKWQIVYVNGRVKRIDIYEVLQDGIIAGGEVKKLVDKIITDGAKDIYHGYLPDLQAGRLGYVAFDNPKGVGPYLEAVGLGEWLE
jgi:hypothetical protein